MYQAQEALCASICPLQRLSQKFPTSGPGCCARAALIGSNVATITANLAAHKNPEDIRKTRGSKLTINTASIDELEKLHKTLVETLRKKIAKGEAPAADLGRRPVKATPRRNGGHYQDTPTTASGKTPRITPAERSGR